MLYSQLWVLLFVSFGAAQEAGGPANTDIVSETTTQSDGPATPAAPTVQSSAAGITASDVTEPTSTEALATITSSSELVEATSDSGDSTSSDGSSASGTETGTIPEETIPVLDLNSFLEPVPELTEQEAFVISGSQVRAYAELKLEQPSLPAADGGAGAMKQRDESELEVLVAPSCPDAEPSGPGLVKKARFHGIIHYGNICVKRNVAIDVKFHYVANGFLFTFPANVQKRVQNQMELLKAAYGGYNINLNWDGSILLHTDIDFTNNRYGSFSDPISVRNRKFRTDTREGGPDVLNIWVVNRIGAIGGSADSYSGYAELPSARAFTYDGVVISLNSLSPSSSVSPSGIDDSSCNGPFSFTGAALVHNVGRWMGLEKTFGAGNCGRGDNIADTNMYVDAGRTCCIQTQCRTGRTYRVQNWMSYSSCAGTLAGNRIQTRGFSSGQVTAMYTQFATFRRNPGNCIDIKRSISSLKRAADEENAAFTGELLVANCSVAIQDVFDAPSIPLSPEVLSGFNTRASELRANPPADDPANPRPAIAQAQGADIPPPADPSAPAPPPADPSAPNTIAAQPTDTPANPGAPQPTGGVKTTASVKTGGTAASPKGATPTAAGSKGSTATSKASSTPSKAAAGSIYTGNKGENALVAVFGWMFAMFFL